jgi:YggT family protein
MIYLVNVLSGIIDVYMLLICVRIILTWFPGAEFGGIMIFLRSICDPYLDWFRRFRLFKNSPLDFSPLLALAVLSLAQGIFKAWSAWGRISLGVILAMLLAAVCSVVSWVLGFFIIILVLRLIAFWGNMNIYSPFWHFIDTISQPVMYRICRALFPARLISYLGRIIISIAALLVIMIALRAAASFGGMLLRMLPV